MTARSVVSCSACVALLLFSASIGFAQEATTPPVAAEPAAPVAPADGAAPAPEPAAAPAASGDVASELATLKAEVAALKAKQEEAEVAALTAQTEEPSAGAAAASEALRVYGFMDFGLDKFFMASDDDGFGLLRPTPATTFVFGNLNLYFDANPVEHLRAMVEVRLTLAPHGEETSLGPPLGTSYERIDTTAFDFSSPSSQSQLRLGGIFIERAWSQYEFADWLKVQWGLFLNPFGIWNLDHGSPTLISLMLPTFIAAQMVPTRLLGVHVYGSKFFGSNEVGYALHISNGRTPLDFDFTEDKAFGARLYFAHEGDFGRLVLGVSGYAGTYVDMKKTINPHGDNIFDWDRTVSYKEEVFGYDAALDVGDLRVRTEGVLRWVNYHGDKTEQIFTADGTEQYLPNRLEWAGYLLAAYRTPIHVEPYLEGELSSKSYTLPRYAGNSRASSSDVAAVTLSAGFNIELTTHTLFKTQVAWARAYDRNFKNKSLDMPYLFVRVVDSF